MKKNIEVDNNNVEFNIYGKSKNCLILLSGWTHDFQYDKSFINELEKKRKVITISYPGYSGSYESNKAQSMKFLSGLIDLIVLELKINKFELVGFSIGCQVVLEYLKNHPKQRAILISPVMHSLTENIPFYGKIILRSDFLVSFIRNFTLLKLSLVNIAYSKIATVTEGKKRHSKFSDDKVSLNGAYDTLIATLKSFINPLLYKDRIRFVFGENEVDRKILDSKAIKYNILKNAGHGSFDTHYKQIANFISKC